MLLIYNVCLTVKPAHVDAHSIDKARITII